MSLRIRYGRPKAASKNTTKGFLEGRGGAPVPSGSVPALPWNLAKAEGVKEVASAGGGRPVNFATRVLIQRSSVKIPSIEPSVSRRFENCSATDTMARTY